MSSLFILLSNTVHLHSSSFSSVNFYLFNTFSFKNQHTEHGEIPYGFMSNIHPIREPNKNKKDTALRSDG